jgi:predicted metal-dependent enzyme (double-stranded beta helix superfamily)
MITRFASGTWGCSLGHAERRPVHRRLSRRDERAVSHPGHQGDPRTHRPGEGKIGTIYHGPDLTILNVVWAPGMAVYPHEHRMWALIGLYGGREDNTFYRRGGRGLEITGGRRLETGDTTLLGPAIIHAVSNPLGVFTGAIHIYGGDFFGMARSEWDPETLVERPWDAARTRKVFADANGRWREDAAKR